MTQLGRRYSLTMCPSLCVCHFMFMCPLAAAGCNVCSAPPPPPTHTHTVGAPLGGGGCV